MGREVPFHPEKVCDECGKTGAYDFMGDCYCPECCDKFDAETDRDSADDETITRVED